MRKFKDYTNQVIVNNYGLEVHILKLYEKRKRATYWNYICPYCGNDKAVNDISKIKILKTCDKCVNSYKTKKRKTESPDIKKVNIVKDYSNDFYNKFVNNKIELLTPYINAKTKILCKCKIDGYEWNTLPSVLLRGGGCPKCAGNLPKTTSSFIEEVNNLWNGEYEVIGEYINAKTKITIRHNICNNEFSMVPSNILNGQQCPYCKRLRMSTSQLMSDDDFKSEIYNLVGDEYTVKSTYYGRLKKVLFHHNNCNYNFWMSPNDFINGGHRCTNKKCIHDRLSSSLKDSEEEFKIKFDNRSNNEYKLLSKYNLSCEKILIEHISCGSKFEMKANNFINGQGCPYCNISKAELKIRDFCELKNINYIWQKSFVKLLGVNGGTLSYDFYFPDKNTLLEYQGEYHDGSLVGKCQTEEKFDIQQEHDKRKRQYAKANNIKLLEIWYWDFENIEEILSRELGLTA